MKEQTRILKRKRGRPRKTVTCGETRKIIPLYPKLEHTPLPPHQDCMVRKKSPQTLPQYSIVEFEISSGSKSPDKHENVKTDDGNIQKQWIRKRDRSSHNAEEKRRKAKINGWISKLADLLCQMPADKKSKCSVLERAFLYINEKEKQDVPQKLLSRINDLEMIIIKLVKLLRQHSVNIPDDIKVVTDNPSLAKEIMIHPALPQHAPLSSTSAVTDAPMSYNFVLVNAPLFSAPHFSSATGNSQLSNVLTNINAHQFNNVPTAIAQLTSNQAVGATSLPCISSPLKNSSSDFLTRQTCTTKVVCSTMKHVSSGQEKTTSSTSTSLSACFKSGNNSKDHEKILWRPVSSLLPISTTCKNDAILHVTTGTKRHSAVASSNGVQGSLDALVSMSSGREDEKEKLELPCHTLKNPIVSLTKLNTNLSTNPTDLTPEILHQGVLEKSIVNPENAAKTEKALKFWNKVASPTQSFGIDSLLVEEPVKVNSCPDNVVFTTPVLCASITNHEKSHDQVCTSSMSSSCLQRSRLSSSGHTVKALLEPNTINCVIQNTKMINLQSDLPAKSLDASTTQHVTTNVSTSSSISGNDGSSKRWGNVLVNAHNSDMLLTSFVLESKFTNKNKPKRNEKQGIKDQNKINSPLKGVLSTVENTTKITTATKSSIPVTSTTCRCISEVVKPLITKTVASSSKGNSLADMTTSAGLCCSSASAAKSSFTSPIKSKLTGIKTTLTCTVVETNTHTDSSSQENYLVKTSSDHSNAVLQIDVINSGNSIITKEKANAVYPRTMNDRTVKNKWLEMEKTEVSIAFTISDRNNEQCSSPVICFPNIGRPRKRSMCHVTDLSQPRKISQNKGGDVTSSSDFSAESLCQPASKKHCDLKKSCINESKQHQKNNNVKVRQKTRAIHHPTKQQQRQQQQSIPRQKLNHQPDLQFPTSLPTILNIFAPAPVPTTNMQQQNIQPGFSNFSAEALVNNTCNVMGNGLQEANFHENMLMAANFTNFSADTLISGQESNMPYAIDNLIAQNNVNQMSNYWNQWLPQEMSLNEPMFQNMSNIQNNMQRSRQNITTECSPIKSIMSILQSSPNSNPELPLNNINTLPQKNNRVDHRGRRLFNLYQNNFPDNIWNNKQPYTQSHLYQLNTEATNENAMFTHLSNINCNNTSKYVGIGNIENCKVDTRINKEKCGPTYGSYSLLNSS